MIRSRNVKWLNQRFDEFMRDEREVEEDDDLSSSSEGNSDDEEAINDDAIKVNPNPEIYDSSSDNESKQNEPEERRVTCSSARKMRFE